MLRALRHTLIGGATRLALRGAPHVPAAALDGLGALLGAAGPWCPVVGATVAANMRRAGVYSPARHRAYFSQLGAHFAGALHALRAAAQPPHGPAELAALAHARIRLDASVAAFAAGAARGGAILVGPHITNYLLSLTRLNQAVPLTVYLRYSRDSVRRTAKQRWYDTSRVAWISEPAEAGGTLGRLGAMAGAIDSGRTLFITPDLPQKHAVGWPAALFGRTVALPAGFALLAIRTGAPLYVLGAAPDGASQRLYVRGPYAGATRARGRVARRQALQDRVQWFADEFAAFVRAAPELWYLWGDKRWTRFFRGDPQYAGRCSPEAVATGVWETC